MILAVLGAISAALSLLALLVWIQPPRPAWWALAGTAAFTGVAAALMSTQPSLWPLLSITLTAATITWHDALTHRIPDTLTLATSALTLAAAGLAAGDAGQWLRAGLSALALTAGYLLLALLGSLGLGDVKYAIPLGFALGWHSWALLWQATLLSFAIGATIATIMLARGKARTAHMPFGPPMATGAALAGVLAAILTR